jgi:DNA-binding transcriptional LysR family regulator
MNLPDIKAFIAFAETGSINRAALRLGLTQPAITRRIQNFEALMAGTSLLDRRVKPAVLTPAGRRVLAHCQRVLKAVAELEACGASHTNPTGQFRIGLSPGLAEIVLSTTLDGLRERFPDLQLRVTSEWTSQLIRKVADCDLDCAIAFVTDHHTLPSMVSSTVIGVETLVVVAARTFDTPRRNGKSVRIRDLESYGWIVNPVGCGYRETLQRAFDRTNASCRFIADILGYDLHLSLVAKGAGLGLVPSRLIKTSPLRRKFRIITVKDFQPEVRVMLLRGTALGNLSLAVNHLEERMSAVLGPRKQLA